MKAILSKPNIRQIAGMMLLFVAYFLTAKAGLSIDAVNQFAALIWPPSGIALAALFLYGFELWPGVAIAAFFINLMLGAPPPVALGIAAGNTCQALAGAYFLREYMGFNPLFSRLQDSFSFILTAFISTVISPTVGTISLYLGGQLTSQMFSQTWVAWWVGDSLGILVVGAFVVRWLYRPLFTKTLPEVLEGLIVFPMMIAVSALIFWTPVSSLGNIPLVYVLFIPLIWAALRTGPRGMTLALVLISGVAISSLYFNHGTSIISGSGELLLLQIFIGTITVIFLLFTSIVEERKEAVINLREHIHKLEDALTQIRIQDEAKNEFIATLGHELRNPLSPIISAVELMRQEGVGGINQKLVDVIQSHTQTIARLLDDLLDITRITRKKFKLQKETLQLESVIQHARETVEAFLKARNHTLSVVLPQEPVWIEADKVRLEQIFINLLFNAAKYTEPGGSIELRVDKKNDHRLRISVKDTGIGIEKNMLGRIFEPFVQVKAPQGQVGSGLGIGLSLTKRLVELHGGTIEARSEGKNKGSEFVVELPYTPHMQLPLPQTSAIPTRRTAPSKYSKILVVDDNEAAAQGLGSLLKHVGHEVQFAYDGPSALEAVKEFFPHVVLLDIGLPGMDGYEVAKKLREGRDASLVLIALSGYGQDEDKRKAMQVGFNYHLTKPVGINEVERLLTL